MRIGFYAPLKAPDHPVPSGDRQMARHLVAALTLAGHAVTVYSAFRSYAGTPDPRLFTALREQAGREVEQVAAHWRATGLPPDLLFTYHPYYKAPDLLGPGLAARFGLPFATAEASLSARRTTGSWAGHQVLVEDAVRAARLNLCFTARDRAGLLTTADPASLVMLPPFLDAASFAFAAPRQAGSPVRLITVAMMRPGDKAESYRFLAEALMRLTSRPWHLTVIGDGTARDAVEAALAVLPADRLTSMGALASDAVPAQLRRADVMVWPGFNEAFGLCYLEAQAVGLPVVAVRNAGTPSVVLHEETGLLTDPDPTAFAQALARLIDDPALRLRFGAAATRFVHGTRSLPAAAAVLSAALQRVIA